MGTLTRKSTKCELFRGIQNYKNVKNETISMRRDVCDI